ncbi:MAG TPA: MG2 domain-containing protein [Chitinophagaceae bacterium]|nr:MG2 domain-containing protein [Chitinophagaceae bacterium]
MRIKTYLVPLIAGTIFLSSCKKNSITLSFTNAKGEVPVLGNLVFRFNHSLATDSMLNAWDSTDYISFEPKLRGKFRWQSPDELVFSPAEPLSPATTYKAKVKSAALRFSKYNSVKGGDKISFHTPLLTLDNAQVIWVGESSTTAVPQADLVFNYRVHPDDLKDKLHIHVDGNDADFTVITVSPDNKISLRINGLKAEDKDRDMEVTIGKGLKPEKGNTRTEEAIVNSMTIPSPFSLTIQHVEAEHDGTEGVVKIITSQQLTSEGIRPFLKFDPALVYTVEPNDYGFTVRSAQFDTEKSYSLTISKGLRGKIGGVMREDYNDGIGFGELESDIKFTNKKAVYLSKKGGKNIEVVITSAPKVKIIISKIYENNLLMAERYGYEPQESRSGPEYASYEEDYYDEYNSGNAQFGDVIYEKEIDTRSLPKAGAGRLLNFSQFEDRLPDFKGVYHVVIRSTEDYWVKDSRFISMSDLGLITKEGTDKIYVFANSIKSAEPLNSVNVSVYSVNNQLLGAATTDKDGMATINFTSKAPIDMGVSGFKPAMIIAKTSDDFNYLPFNNTKVNTSRFDVGGKRNNASGFDAFVYAERDVYRPGEKINFSVILRDAQWKSPGDVPLKIKFLMPNGKELKSVRKSLNDEGSLEGSIAISTSAITGSYTMEVYTSNDVLLSSKSFSVEEFVPDRIRVSAKMDKTFLRPGEKATLAINATNFFGPPAANRKYETEIQVRQKSFSPEKYDDYDFSLTNQNTFFDKQVKEGTTDETGNAMVEYEVPDAYLNMGTLQTNFYTTVFDETGRPVSRGTSLDVFTQNVFFGIKQDWSYYSPLNQPVKLQLAAVNKDGNPVSATAKVEVIKHEYRTVLTKSGNYFRYESQKQDKLMVEQQLSISNGSVFSYIPRTPGDYEVKIYNLGASNYVSRGFYSYGSWGGNNSSFEVSKEGNIDISIDKKSYYTGESVKALFKTPFSGKMLVTMETDHIVSHQIVEVSNRTASVDLKLNVEHVPNVYISATLIKPHEVSDIPLTVAHGFKNVPVEEKNRKIEVKVEAPKTVRSKTHQKVTVKAAPGSMVTLSAVDNGVLQISDFKTPDPYDHFYQKKALQVAGYDLYPLLFEEVRAKLSSTGGDGFDKDMEKRANAMPAKRVRVVSYWSGIKKANSHGVAEFEFDVPQFSGELRLMAVSYKGNSFGAADNTMTVADPIVVSTALPRFLSPGDTVNVPVTLTNTTDRTANVTANIAVEGPMKVVGGNGQLVNLAARTEGRAIFKIVADPTINVGKVNITVSGMGEKFTDATEISVRPPSALQKMTGTGSIIGGSTQKINIGLSDFMPTSVNYSLVVSRSPALELGEQLRYLLQYPYGCTEQTVSAAFPQLYYGDLSDLMQLERQQDKVNANTNIIEAIRKIKMRQLYNGAVTLWDGEGKEDWWTTIYSAHFLLEAKKAGFDVDISLLNTMLNYISNKLKTKETITYYYNRDQNKKIAPKEVAYGLYVLALAGRTNVPAMNYYKANTSLLALDSRYLLAAAYATAGDKRSFTAMLPASFSGEESVAQTGGSYYSDVRDEAISLNALLEVDPGNAQIGIMVKHVADKLKTRRWLSTQERAFAFLALGKHARSANNSNATAEIKVNGKSVGKTGDASWKADMKTLGGTAVEIITKGSGRLYYFWQAEGMSASGAYKEEDSYLKVRKHFYDRNGKALSGNSFKQNDLIIIGITLERSFSSPVENVVITDLLPAGFEIENPRTKEIPGMDWIKDAMTPTALDVRDDRIHFFVNAEYNKQTYYYAVRAVSPGNYKMGPVSADAMYNGEYHSYNGAGVVRVIQ